MTEHKFTDEEVITDLQNASEWFKEHGRNTNTAIIGICDRALDLINRQKAEVEELTVSNERLAKILTFYTLQYGTVRDQSIVIETARVEAIKEFAEGLKNYYRHLNGPTVAALVEYHIDQIMEEKLCEK